MGRKKVRAYLTNEQAKELGLKVNNGGRYWVTKEQKRELVLRNKHKALEEYCEENGIPLDSVTQYWHKGKHFSVFTKNKKDDILNVKAQIINEMINYAPIYPKIKYEESTNGHLLVIDPADIHIGKLCNSFETGEDYNSQIAVKRVLEGVHGILQKAQGWKINDILLVAGNDILHIDTPKRTTTSGTPQDTDGMWYTNFIMARRLLTDIIEMLMQVAPVHVVFNPSNHDFMSGFQLLDAVSCWFHKCEDVTFDADMKHRKYYSYGNSLIGTTHGDGAKTADLPILMAQEASEDWSKTKHRYWYTHHVHHKTAKDLVGVTIESMRSPSGADGWHHRNGFQHSPRAIEGFIHHSEHGQVARLTHIF